ncbi:putative baseplate assembly protein [Streptoalloteichus tenebrarius]|uniref:Baseplate assembly protein n=1 Tax=Streptoalloteichus tenebrarius (strain ATCC 17920 / DSM 40477 / JCM 4838 / CBS 697.72 / NBRC 16177 / NCIMB 11028 / NRRL B-12390 / A12253. 1 / ISP 5477) TaxID=1933 RepID=A0ABT1HNU4_STRSD|nr:putative baseplate assembly protein [Streptoalloteichus tenebrarius]MCP2257173.1 putative baseplate assembly protein [Streptoalloteichus tenebrarius]BFE98807.1 putative baseplate assembly protein [Streptoalloteichus tenebrarius]
MTLETPKLDRRTYADLVAEAHRRIRRFCPEWTDLNPSDPGVTLVELFAWLTETMLYELNQVPDRAYLKFLELVGLRPRPALPARAEVTFTPNPQAERVVVPAGTQVAATAGDALVVFECDEECDLVPHALTDIVVVDGRSRVAVLTEGVRQPGAFRPLGWIPRVGNALYLGFSPPPGAPDNAAGRFPARLRLHVTLPPSVRAGLARRCSAPVAAVAPDVRLVWEYWGREDETWWRPLPVLTDATAQLTVEGYLTVEGPGAIRPTRAVEGIGPRYWVRCRLAGGRYPKGREPEIEGITPNTATVHNLVTVRDELLGQSEGHPDESYRLLHSPVAASSVEIEVRTDPELDLDPAAEPRAPWRRVDDFLASKPGDRHYTVDGARGTVSFGDGRRGRIPPVGAEIIAVTYRHGGGAAGNVPAGAITTLLSELPGVDAVTNPRSATGGADQQSLADLKREAPALLRHQQRAVTAEDYAALARAVPGVADAVALPLTHPEHPGEKVPGAVTVVIVADTDDRQPKPGHDLVAAVCAHLEPHRLVATELYVRAPAFVVITVEATLVVERQDRRDVVCERAKSAVNAFLAPLQWEGERRRARFQQWFLPARLSGLLAAVPGVLTVQNLTVRIGDQTVEDLLKPIPLAPHELVTYGDHDIDVHA